MNRILQVSAVLFVMAAMVAAQTTAGTPPATSNNPADQGRITGPTTPQVPTGPAGQPVNQGGIVNMGGYVTTLPAGGPPLLTTPTATLPSPTPAAGISDANRAGISSSTSASTPVSTARVADLNFAMTTGSMSLGDVARRLGHRRIELRGRVFTNQDIARIKRGESLEEQPPTSASTTGATLRQPASDQGALPIVSESVVGEQRVESDKSVAPGGKKPAARKSPRRK